jgi:hypothetical protein
VISVLGNDGALLALGVVLVLVAVLVMDSLIRRIRKNDSRPSVPQEPPPPKT